MKYYVAEPRNHIVTNVNGKIEMIYDLIVNVDGPIIEMQQVHHPAITV